MFATIEYITHLEWMNYAATQAIAEHTPGLTLLLRDDVIITSSQTFPTSDTTHACLLRATAQTADGLIEDVSGYFQSRGLPVTIFLSPACAPPDLPERLSNKGFVQHPNLEAWMIFPDLLDFKIPAAAPQVITRRIGKNEALIFARIFLTAFDMPVDFAPQMAELLTPSVGLPGVYHYLAWRGDEPIGTVSLICYRDVAIIGGAGVVPAHRRGKAISNLTIQAARDAQKEGAKTVILQTAANTLLERLLRISGFKRVFTRTSYTLL